MLSLFSIASASRLSGSEHEDFMKFQDFLQKYEKTYESMEELEKRFTVFRGMLVLADKRNADNIAAGGEDNVHGVTKFMDFSHEEFKELFLMKPGYYVPRDDAEEDFEIVYNVTAGNVDWRNQGVVSPVKDQGQCGSCWAFSATEAVESYGQIAFKYGLTPLSAQQSCSCTYSYNGCNGGNPQNVYKAAIQNYGGEESNSAYPYTVNCGTCQVKSSTKKYMSTNGYTNAAKGTLQSVLDTSGPPSVAVAAETWNTYHGGVVVSCPGSIDHAVQAVGYVNSGVSTPYFIVRNSWGTSWGEQGYIYLAMSGDTCLVQDDINYPHAASV